MTSRTFECTAASVGAARRFVAAHLAGADDETVGLAQLLVSELATNCVLHAATEFVVSVSRTGAVVRVEVTDFGPGTPQVADPRPSDTHGRGLRFVDSFAGDWGTSISVSGSKTTWFALPDVSVASAPANRSVGRC